MSIILRRLHLPYLGAQVKAVEAVEASVRWSVVLVAVAKVPFPYGVCGVAGILEVLRHQWHIHGDAGRHQRFDVHVLPANSGKGSLKRGVAHL